MHPRVATIRTKLPPHFATQDELTQALAEAWSKEHYNSERLLQLHKSVQVGGRYLARPLEDYKKLRAFGERNDAWIEAAMQIGESVVRDALQAAKLQARDIDYFFFVTTTGIATPSIDALLCHRLGTRGDVKRSPLFGLGCAGGAAALCRAADVLRGTHNKNALVLSVELCSLTLQREDVSVANIIASGLFGDGAAAAILSTSDGCGPLVVDSRAQLYPNSEGTMGWHVVDGGFKIVLNSKVPAIVREHIPNDASIFLAAHGLRTADVQHWIVHPGGPKVLEAFAEVLSLPEGALQRSWNNLRTVGNLSSAAVMFIAADFLDSLNHPDAGAHKGEYGVLCAMGPGFATEMALLQW